MDSVSILVQNLTVKFLLSYKKTWTLKEKLVDLSRNIRKRQKTYIDIDQYHVALSNINLSIYKGDIVGIIGPNGCGKTTLLRAISGIFYPDEGSVYCSGRVSSLLSLGTGFNNALNGIDNIRLNGLTIGMSLAEIEEKIPQIVEFADIGEYINMPMRYYSSGMISRLSFSIVMSMQPDILLIDEIFSVGDLAFKQKSEKAMHELLSKATCQLIVTHNLKFVREHCNRAIFMEKGTVIIDDKPEQVVDFYERKYGSL